MEFIQWGRLLWWGYWRSDFLTWDMNEVAVIDFIGINREWNKRKRTKVDVPNKRQCWYWLCSHGNWHCKMTHSPMVFTFLMIFAVLWEDFSLHDQQIWLHEWIHRWMDGPCNKIVDPFRASCHTSTHIQSNFIYCISIGTWPAWCNQSSDKSKIQDVSLVVQNSVLTNTSRMRYFYFYSFYPH